MDKTKENGHINTTEWSTDENSDSQTLPSNSVEHIISWTFFKL